ncbi:MAG: intradiol ring-cleavage dioxygenase [Thermoleophilaceae bacterium]
MAETPLTRRGSLLKAGGLLAATLGAAGCASDSSKTTASTADASTGPAGVATGAVSCVLAPEQTEGPYYVAGEKLRRNIADGRPGAALALRLSVVDASSCKAIPGATVEVWHCDAGGAYSHFNASGNFLRGAQKANANGVATFHTIYPGWYQGRTVHIHVKVHLGGNVVHTGQLYFSDTVTDAVYRRSPYKSRAAARDTRNAADSIYRNGGRRSTLAVRKSGSAYVGTIVMGVQRA